jgi:hypothetical protein
MLLSVACTVLSVNLAVALPVFEQQVPLFQTGPYYESTNVQNNAGESIAETAPYIATFGASHLSEWCALSKQHFLDDVKANKAQDWIIVTGNEAGGASYTHVMPCWMTYTIITSTFRQG